MQVVLENEDQVEAWLDHSIKFEDIFSSENPKVKGMFTPKERKDFQYHPVSKKSKHCYCRERKRLSSCPFYFVQNEAVNNIKYESDDIIEPVKETTEGMYKLLHSTDEIMKIRYHPTFLRSRQRWCKNYKFF